jgi:K+-sensing histidine kinase KdpD
MKNQSLGFLLGGIALLLEILALLPLRSEMNTASIALAFLLVVLFTAVGAGRNPAFVISIAAMLCLNFFFIPPYHTFRVADPQNWIALAVFLLTSLVVGGLSSREKRRAEEAESRKKEIERLYAELREAFAKASEAEALKQSDRLKTALLDAVTHDLRTPLTSVKAAVTTLLAGGSNEETSIPLDEEGQREMLEVINTEVDRLNHLVEGLIEMAKIEAGAMEPRRTWVNVDEIVSIALTRAEDTLRDHQTRVDLEPDLPLIRVDEKALVEVLFVLLENAAKYSPPKSEIVITAKRSGKEGILMSVEDQGIGIPHEFREKVFEKFFRLSETSIPLRGAGLGMGLAIARGIVEAHKGRIWIESGPDGHGTRVFLAIPFERPYGEKQ